MSCNFSEFHYFLRFFEFPQCGNCAVFFSRRSVSEKNSLFHPGETRLVKILITTKWQRKSIFSHLWEDVHKEMFQFSYVAKLTVFEKKSPVITKFFFFSRKKPCFLLMKNRNVLADRIWKILKSVADSGNRSNHFGLPNHGDTRYSFVIDNNCSADLNSARHGQFQEKNSQYWIVYFLFEVYLTEKFGCFFQAVILYRAVISSWHHERRNQACTHWEICFEFQVTQFLITF